MFLLSYCDNFGLVPEASTDSDFVEFFWDELSVTPTLFLNSGVSYADIW